VVLFSFLKLFIIEINKGKQNYKNMKKNVQRINESQLRAIVAESIKKVLNESFSIGKPNTILNQVLSYAHDIFLIC